MSRGMIYCKSCDSIQMAKVLDWDEQIFARSEGHHDFDMGNYISADDPPIHYYRRVRRCARCGELLYTGEIDLDLIGEIASLREVVRSLREEAERAFSANAAIRKRLGE